MNIKVYKPTKTKGYKLKFSYQVNLKEDLDFMFRAVGGYIGATKGAIINIDGTSRILTNNGWLNTNLI